MEITRTRPETQRGPAERFMTHIALQESDEGGNPAHWGEHVTDDEYLAGEE